jgi:hypothetical protein
MAVPAIHSSGVAPDVPGSAKMSSYTTPTGTAAAAPTAAAVSGTTATAFAGGQARSPPRPPASNRALNQPRIPASTLRSATGTSGEISIAKCHGRPAGRRGRGRKKEAVYTVPGAMRGGRGVTRWCGCGVRAWIGSS